MDRLFGSKKQEAQQEQKIQQPEIKKPEEPQINLEEHAFKIDQKAQALYKRIEQLDIEIQENFKKSKQSKGVMAQTAKQKCIYLLQTKKQLEQQVQTIASTQMTLNQVAFTKENIDNTLQTAQAMKQAVKEQKQLLEKINFDDLDQVREDLEDMMWESKNFNEQMNRNCEFHVNEDDLDAEFEELEEQIFQEKQQNQINQLGNKNISQLRPDII